MKIVRISPELVVEALSEGNVFHLGVTKGLPKGCRLHDARVEQDQRGGHLVLEFAEPKGEAVLATEDLTITVERLPCADEAD